MKVFGRKILDYNKEIPVDFDDLVFVVDGARIVVSLYNARTHGRVEIHVDNGCISVRPRAANLIEIEPAP